MDLSGYALDPVRTDTDFVLSRGTEKNPTASMAPSILALAPVAEHPAPELVRRLESSFRATVPWPWLSTTSGT